MTAIEWLQEKYKQQGTIFKSQFEQAKEMEKQQIIDAFKKYRNSKFKNPDEIDWTKSGEQYYNETFNKCK